MSALSQSDFENLVLIEAEGQASADQLDVLEAERSRWERALLDLLEDTEDDRDAAESLSGPERRQVLDDFDDLIDTLEDALIRIFGPIDYIEPEPKPDRSPSKNNKKQKPAPQPVEELPPGIPTLQLSWVAGRVVAWKGAVRAESGSVEEVLAELASFGAPGDVWQPHAPVQLPGGQQADAVEASIGDILGWLVALGTRGTERVDDYSPSVAWLGRVSVLGVELVATGRMVPQLQRAKKTKKGGDGANFEVRWAPSLLSPERLTAVAAALPGTVLALGAGADPRTITQSAIADMVDAICRTAARRVEVPEPSPNPKSKVEVGEAVLARLDGTPFTAPPRLGAETMRRLEQWGRPVTGGAKLSLVVQLDPPDESNAWHLKVLAPSAEGVLEPVEVALVTSSNNRRKEVQHHLNRLERVLPVLKRPGADRRGEVVLSQDEAWELMAETGETVEAAGFEVRVPELTKKRKPPALRLSAEPGKETTVGAQQLADVRWSAVFDDVELTAAEISKLAAQARPLVKSRGRWIALDHADLAEAAAALADRAKTTQLTGAEMLRHALGLEGSPLGGGISLGGQGWAAELLASAQRVPDAAATTLEGFEGELRSYQAEAAAWLSFLDDAGLGGCLALDMGLGKTPTVLARIRATMGNGAALVIAPPAVVGNWAAESARFTPDLKVLVHHGASRASGAAFTKAIKDVDVVITTFGTAVRDVEMLAKVSWDRVVLDEAQVIKNPTSETAIQLRRIEARSRLALTGTPIENGLGDLWAIMDFVNPALVGPRAPFVAQLSSTKSTGGPEDALRALNGILVFRRTKSEPAIAAELPDRIDELDHCSMTPEQIGLYQAVLDSLVVKADDAGGSERKGAVLAAITALKQICNHPVNYEDDDKPLAGRSGKLARLEEIVGTVFAAGERMLIFTHFASWGEKLATHLSETTGIPIACYHGGLARGARDRLVSEFQEGEGPGALVLSLKAGGTGLNLTAASHVVLYDRWWNPAVEDQARDRVWRIGQTKTVICHRLVCPGTVDERVEEVVAGKRRIADMVLPKSSSIGDLDAEQLRAALGLSEELMVAEEDDVDGPSAELALTAASANGEAAEDGVDDGTESVMAAGGVT